MSSFADKNVVKGAVGGGGGETFDEREEAKVGDDSLEVAESGRRELKVMERSGF